MVSIVPLGTVNVCHNFYHNPSKCSKESGPTDSAKSGARKLAWYKEEIQNESSL